MNQPNKVVIEITGDISTIKVLDDEGNELFTQTSTIESSHSSSTEGDIFDSQLNELYPEIADSIDDLSFGPFGIACKLHELKYD